MGVVVGENVLLCKIMAMVDADCGENGCEILAPNISEVYTLELMVVN